MSKRVKNALIIILLLVIVLGGGALSLFDVFGYRTWTTEKLTSDFRAMAQQKFGEDGEAIVLIDYNDDAIALLCCNAARDNGYFEIHKRDLISGKWEKSMGAGNLGEEAGMYSYSATYQRPDNSEGTAYFSLDGKDNEPSLRLY